MLSNLYILRTDVEIKKLYKEKYIKYHGTVGEWQISDCFYLIGSLRFLKISLCPWPPQWGFGKIAHFYTLEAQLILNGTGNKLNFFFLYNPKKEKENSDL